VRDPGDASAEPDRGLVVALVCNGNSDRFRRSLVTSDGALTFEEHDMGEAKRIAAAALVGGVVLGSLSIVTAPAEAKGREVTRAGSCSGAAHTKLKVKTDNGRLEVEGQVDSNRNGQTWRWRIRHDGAVVARGTRQTHAPSGSFEVRRLMANHAGQDRVVFRARHVGSGQVCRTVVNF